MREISVTDDCFDEAEASVLIRSVIKVERTVDLFHL